METETECAAHFLSHLFNSKDIFEMKKIIPILPTGRDLISHFQHPQMVTTCSVGLSQSCSPLGTATSIGCTWYQFLITVAVQALPLLNSIHHTCSDSTYVTLLSLFICIATFLSGQVQKGSSEIISQRNCSTLSHGYDISAHKQTSNHTHIS